MPTPRHQWIRLPRVVDPAGLADLLDPDLPPPLTAPLVAHRRLRGPYTATGALLRAVVATADAALVRRHQIELLSIAPELRAIVPASRETLTSLAVPKERTRFYSRVRTQRMSHGVVEFLHACLRDGGPRSLAVDVVAADHTDLEFVAALVRRTDPAVLTVVVLSGEDAPGEPLASVLAEHAEPRRAPVPDDCPAGSDDLAAATRYVDSDGTLELPALVAAYDRLPAASRVALHDRRADELAARAEPSLALGAIPYHRERGSDPATTGADAVGAALNRCLDMGFYHATIDFGLRGRALVDPADMRRWWMFTTKMTTSLAALNRPNEAEDLYTETVAMTRDPHIHMQANYARGMLYTRHHAEEDRDHQRAKGFLNQAVALAALLFEGGDQAFESAFQRNGLALVESHLKNLPEALRLVTSGIEELDARLDADQHALHRSVLVHNKGQVLTGLGRLDEALECFTAVIERDPNYPDYYFDRGNLHQRLGHAEAALADYETAIRLGPPFPEAEYNKAELLLGHGEVDRALAGFGYVLELEPDMVDAYVNRAGLYLELGEIDLAAADATRGLAEEPGNAYLHAVLGQVHAATEDHAAAHAEFDRALSADPTLLTALAGRAAAAHALGDSPAALSDLDTAITLSPDDPAIRYNRAFVYEASHRITEAIADLTAALTATPDDEDVLAALSRCRSSIPA